MVDIIPRYLARKNGFDTFAYSDWRRSLLQRSDRGTMLMDVNENNALLMMPTVETWPNATDTNGQSFPAGTVGVRFRYIYTSSAAVNNQANTYLWAVPDTLPVGYTPRWDRDANKGTSTNEFGSPPRTRASTGCSAGIPEGLVPSLVGFMLPSVANGFNNPYRIRSDSGLSDYFWMPECQSDVCISAVTSNAGFWSTYPTAGVRYLRIGNGTFSTGAVPITFEIRRNADGSATGTGDTLAYSYTVPPFTPIDSGYVSPAGLLAPLGQKCFWYFKDFNGAAPSYRMGARCDIPFPFTATGLDSGGGHLIAPGGTA